MTDYTAWLVEINEPVSGPIYYQLKDDNDWTLDHDAALHFARKEDAQKIIDYYGWTRATAVEHMWPEATSCHLCNGDCSAIPGGPPYNCPTYHPADVAWVCDDDRYPFVLGIVTTNPETVTAWVAGGIKFTPLVRRSSTLSSQQYQTQGK